MIPFLITAAIALMGIYYITIFLHFFGASVFGKTVIHLGRAIIPFYYWLKKDRIIFEINIKDIFEDDVKQYVADLTATQKKNVIIKVVGEAKKKPLKKKRVYKRKSTPKTGDIKKPVGKKTGTKNSESKNK